MSTTNVITIEIDVFIDDETAVLVDEIISKYDEVGIEQDFQGVIKTAFFLGASKTTLNKTLEFMKRKITAEVSEKKKRIQGFNCAK